MTKTATTLTTTDRCTNSTPIFTFLLTIPLINYNTQSANPFILNKQSHHIHPRLLLNQPLILLFADHVRAVFGHLPRAFPLVKDHELHPVIREDDRREDSEHASNGLEVMSIADEANPTAGLIGEVGHESAEAHPEEHHLVGLSHEFHVFLLAGFTEPDVVFAVWRFGVDEVVVAPLHVLLVTGWLGLRASVRHN